MSDQRMNASDQGSQPDSGSSPNDQVNVDAQGSIRGREGKGTRPEPSDEGNLATNTGPEPHGDVTEQAHRKGQSGGSR